MKERENPTYVLGHSDTELQRLVAQSNFFGELTEQVFHNAGIQTGMRVLDVGCGAGDVSFLAAKMVGPSGEVIGVDKSAEAIETASKRAEAARLKNVKFMQGAIDEIDLLEPVDAAVGRFVLMYSADPALTLRNIARNVKAGGVIAFQEMDMTGVKSLPRVPLFQKHTEWIIETFRRGGTEAEMGLKLYSTFLNAGLAAPRMILGARVEGGRDSEGFEILTQTTRSLLPMMEKFGIATPEEVGVETMAERLRDAVTAAGSAVVLPHLIGAWTRKDTS